MGKQHRQGDVFFTSCNKPNVKNMKQNTSPIVAYGEVTGHSHKIMTPAFSELESYVDTDGNIFVMSKKEDIVIGHDEHDNIVLDKGQWWNITFQREYDPIMELERRVLD